MNCAQQEGVRKVTGGWTGPDLNIDGTTDKLRDRLDAYQDSKQPARDDDGQGPMFR